MIIELDPLMTWVIVIGALVVLVAAFLIGRRTGVRRTLNTMRRYAHPANLSDEVVDDAARYRAALIVNPTKTDVRNLAAPAAALCRFEGWNPPRGRETSVCPRCHLP